ncbi:hypothetical protein ACLB2K_063784 [Fragaria x ananassa]
MESLSLSPNTSSLPLVLKACTRFGAVERGRSIHSLIRNLGFDTDVRVGTALVDFYCKCGLIEDAFKVFDEMRERDLVLWNALIHGCVGCGCFEEGVELFREMQGEGLRPNSRSLVAVLLACREVSGLGAGKEVHYFGLRNGLLEGDAHVGTALIGFYVGFDVGMARLVFDEMVVRNVVSLNAMITVYVDAGEYLVPLELFVQLLEEGVRFDSVMILVVIQACGKIGNVELAGQIHQMAVKCGYISDIFVVNALLNMYSECGCFELSRALFETVSNRDVAMWNSMLAAYSEYGLYDEAVSLFSRMRREGCVEDERTVYIMLSLCEELSEGLRECKDLHALARKSGMEINFSLGNTLLSMYAEFNCVESVQKVFAEMKGLDVISWNTLIRALAFYLLGSTFVAVLSACRHSGMIEMGLKLFHTMVYDLVITPELVHYGCVVDLLCHAGRLDEAREFIESMPIEPDASVWRALLNGCRVNSAVKLAGEIFKKLVELEPMNAGNYVLLSNIYAAAGLWLEVRKIRTLLREKGLKKPPGTSWIVIKSQVHSFVSSDTSHLDSNRIYACLNSLSALTKEIGYIPDLQWVLLEEENSVERGERLYF